jgi:23S rRNA (uracil-5-)-methyltransferase RumA
MVCSALVCGFIHCEQQGFPMPPLTNKALKKHIVAGVQAGTPTDPRCPHADMCGGCTFQGYAYADQVATKRDVLRDLWAEVSTDVLAPELAAALEVVPSPDPYEYRTRMDYVATKGRFGLRRSGRFNYIVELETCHLIPPAAFDAAHRLWLRANELGLPDYNIRSHEGFLRYIVVRRSPQNTWLLAAVTAAGDYDAEMSALADLALALPGGVGFHWLINDSRTDLSFGEPLRSWGAETLPMEVGANTLHIGPNTFFQNNVHLLLPLLDAVRDEVLAGTQPAPRIADLYCGVGAIALHLGHAAASVVGVEAHAESTRLAEHNAALNGAGHLSFVAADTADFLRQQEPGSFDCIVADPPRTGLGPEVCAELRRLAPRRIVYVSCNPLTQIEDMQHLTPAYRISRLRGYDMFPHTPHVEALAVLDAA